MTEIFRRGDIVECVDDGPRPWAHPAEPDFNRPTKGGRYTVREARYVVRDFYEGQVLWLVEIVNEPRNYTCGICEKAFAAPRFKLIKPAAKAKCEQSGSEAA